MASGSSRQTLHSVWNKYDVESSNKQESIYRHVPRNPKVFPEKFRSARRTSQEHLSQVFDSEHKDSYSISHQKEEKRSSLRKFQSQDDFSHARNYKRIPSYSGENTQDQNGKKPLQYEDGRAKSYQTFNQTRNPVASRNMARYPVAGRNNSYEQATIAKEHISNSRYRENYTRQIKPKINNDNAVTRQMSYGKLMSLTQKDPEELLLTLTSHNIGFLKLIESPNISNAMMSCILIALGKVSKSKLRANVQALMHNVTSRNSFMLYRLPMHMVFLQSQPSDVVLDELQHLIEFLKIFADSQPATASEMVSILAPVVMQTMEKCQLNSSMGHVKESLSDMVKQMELFVEQHTQKAIKRLTTEEKLQQQKPPEDFHDIPVLPGEHDVYNYEPFLRPNIVKGKYLNVDHYLDVQFRLLREDFVRPLREGIVEFKLLKDKKKARKSKDLRVYLNVHVIGSEFIHGTLVHLLQFDAEKFKKVAWEYSKRFLTGSLLCLSADNFQTMFFATVLRREPQKLEKGLLMIKFEELMDTVHRISPLTDFVVLETEAYFEAYRHILVALQTIDDLPLKKYIVDVEKNIGRPQYMSNDMTYDISPLLLPIDVSTLHRSNDSSRPEHPQNAENGSLKSLHILNDFLWPKEKEVGLDASQLKALKVALTKEFAVIQGPPGTGKTYIGLRIVQLLLHNATKWNSFESPILVVCYTNHALDQFLEGILNFTHKVGRIGGRCNSESVEPYLLRNLRSKMIAEKTVPKHIFVGIKEKITHLNALQTEVRQTELLMQKGAKTVLGEQILRQYMKSTHYTSLTRHAMHLRNNRSSSAIYDGHIIHDWLEIPFSGFELGGLAESVFNMDLNDDERVELGVLNHNHFVYDQPVCIDKDDENKERSEDDESKGERSSDDENESERSSDDENEGERSSDDEGDIDFLEAMRGMDEDFSGVDFRLPETAVEDFPVVEEGGWKTQRGGKNRGKFIQKMLRQTSVMSSSEADRVVDIWKLKFEDRWRLYRFWLNSCISAKQEEIRKTQEKVCQEYKQLCEMKLAEDLHVLQGLDIIGMTTTGAAKYRTILQTLNPRVVIVEEAAEILESHIITSLSPNTQHLILIGDHQQLRPSPTVYQLATRYNLNISLFERMIKNNLEPCVLSIQHRMRPSIAELLVPHIYAELKNDESVMKFEDIKGVSSNVFFLNHSFYEGKEHDSTSKVNSHEAAFLAEFCRYLLLQGYLASQITILTAYSGQLILLKKITKKNPLYRGVRITVVDNFQGEENDIILISFVRSNEEGLIGFLKTANRVCVALSRAKKGLYCVGNFMLLAEKSKLWKDILATLENQNAVGNALELCCQNHPKRSNFVSSPGDFSLVPEGGCTLPCEYRLECGHTCTRMCHPYDPLHQNFQCKKQCGKTLCEFGHMCQKQCYKKCGECCVEVLKVMPHCQHEVLVPCHTDPVQFKCSSQCNKKLSCGHLCTNMCGEKCVIQCQKKITVPSPCGHVVAVFCFQSESELSVMSACNNPCNTELDCGHLCSGTCNNCHQGRLHIACKNPCRRILVCGHQCNSQCSKNCPPCEKKCENRCFHSKCQRKCGVPCNPCKEKCLWMCVHQQCTRLCYEPCNRTPCDMPCPALLRCGHNCMGLCGEPCPKLCGICNGAQLREVFFGTEDDEDARFTMLEDCRHVFEVNGITQWMELDGNKSGEIQMKCCPRCKTVIRRNLRFSNVIKACLSDVEKVKSITFGEEKNIELNKEKLLGRIKSELRLSDSLIQSIVIPLKRQNLNILEVKRCENVINIAASLQEICTKQQLDFASLALGLIPQNKLLFEWKSGGITRNTDGIRNCLCETATFIDRFLRVEHVSATFQQLKEITRELKRLKFSSDVWNLLRKTNSKISTNLDFRKKFAGVMDYLLRIKFIPFGESQEEQMRQGLKTLMQMCSFAVLGISDTEKKSILSAMDLSAGHWYQCPNGHVYCITECGGAMETSKCNECGATIGGGQHRVLDDNRIATDMDGAQQDAWTIAANADNYDLRNLW